MGSQPTDLVDAAHTVYTASAEHAVLQPTASAAPLRIRLALDRMPHVRRLLHGAGATSRQQYLEARRAALRAGVCWLAGRRVLEVKAAPGEVLQGPEAAAVAWLLRQSARGFGRLQRLDVFDSQIDYPTAGEGFAGGCTRCC